MHDELKINWYLYPPRKIYLFAGIHQDAQMKNLKPEEMKSD